MGDSRIKCENKVNRLSQVIIVFLIITWLAWLSFCDLYKNEKSCIDFHNALKFEK